MHQSIRNVLDISEFRPALDGKFERRDPFSIGGLPMRHETAKYEIDRRLERRGCVALEQLERRAAEPIGDIGVAQDRGLNDAAIDEVLARDLRYAMCQGDIEHHQLRQNKQGRIGLNGGRHDLHQQVEHHGGLPAFDRRQGRQVFHLMA